MKLFKVLFYLGRFWDWYDLVNGIIDEKYSFCSLSNHSLNLQFYDEYGDKKIRLTNKNVKIDFSKKRNVVDLLNQLYDTERIRILMTTQELNKLELKILKLTKKYKNFEAITPTLVF